jgi:putative aldouronate transport system permease protein
MRYKDSLGSKWFLRFNYTFLTILSLICIFPVIHILAISFSSSSAATSGNVTLWPVEFTLASYTHVLSQPDFLASFWVTIKRVVLGTTTNMLLTILIAYPLSKEVKEFRWRSFYVWFFVLTMIFHGGLVPLYMTVKAVGLIDNIWALILPTAVPVFNVVLLLNFFRGLPRELEESAKMDGANHFTILWKIYIPLSMPALATITLFALVFHWNSWFDGLIYMNRPENYPLQSFLQTVVIQKDLSMITEKDLDLLKVISDRTNRAAQIFIATLPILLVYPFLQRFFIHGIVLGSVKE